MARLLVEFATTSANRQESRATTAAGTEPVECTTTTTAREHLEAACEIIKAVVSCPQCTLQSGRCRIDFTGD